MEQKKLAILGSFFILFVVLVVLFIKSGGEERLDLLSPISFLEIDSSSDEPKKTKKIVLYFPSEKDTLLHPEERVIIDSPSVIRMAIQTIQELLLGSKNGFLLPFPAETKLRGLFITTEGIAYIDFSRDLQKNHVSGSSAEIASIYSIVNSLTYNFESIKRVFILIEGGEKETFGGHINLSRPFLPRYDLISK